MTQAEEIYDWLLTLMVHDPFVACLGSLYVVGRWVLLLPKIEGRILMLESRTQGVEVLGEGATWNEARDGARRRLIMNGSTSPSNGASAS